VLSPAFAGEITEAMFVPKMLRCDTLPEDPRGLEFRRINFRGFAGAKDARPQSARGPALIAIEA